MLKSIAVQISTLVLALVLLPTLIVSLVGGSRFSETNTSLVTQVIQNNVYFLAESVSWSLSDARSKARLISQADALETNSPQVIQRYLEELKSGDPMIQDLIVYRLDGDILATTTTSGNSPEDISGPKQQFEDSLRQAASGQQDEVFVIPNELSDTQVAIRLLTPVTDETNLTVIGVLVVDYALNQLGVLFRNTELRTGLDTRLFLMDIPTGTVSPIPEPDEIDLLQVLNQHVTNWPEQIDAIKNDDDGDYLVIFNELKADDDLSWGILAITPRSSIAAPIRESLLWEASIVIVLAAIFLILSLIGTRVIMRPLEQLKILSSNLARGQKVDTPMPRGISEIDAIRQALVTAFNSIEEHAINLEQVSEDLTTAQRIAHLGSWEIDFAAQQVRMSDEMYRLLDIPRDEQLSISSLTDHIHPDDQSHLEILITEAIKQQQPGLTFSNKLKTTDHSLVWLQTILAIDYSADGQLVAVHGTTRDISDSRNMEAQLIQAQKMESIGQLTSGLAHDFNNLLTIVLGNLDMLLEMLPEESSEAELITSAIDAADRGATLTHRLLAFSRQQMLQPVVIDLNESIRGMDELLTRTLGEHIEVKMVNADELWLCEIDPIQLESLILNLAINSRDAMPEGGKLTIETANTQLDDEFANKQIDVKLDQYVEITITDTGIGIDATIIDRVFDPFFTTKSVGRGSGLGLSMVHGFVKQSGGHIKISSDPGHGTTVKVYLPRSSAQSLPSTSPVILDEVPTGDGEKILVVEDNDSIRELIEKLLSGLGYETSSAADGLSALALFDKGLRVDLLLTDVILTGDIDGLQLAAKLTSRFPDLPTLYVSGYTASAIVQHGGVAPPIELLSKPFTKAELAHAVKKIMRAAKP